MSKDLIFKQSVTYQNAFNSDKGDKYQVFLFHIEFENFLSMLRFVLFNLILCHFRFYVSPKFYSKISFDCQSWSADKGS